MPQTGNLGLFRYTNVNLNIQASHQIDRLLQHGIVDVNVPLSSRQGRMPSKVLQNPCPNALLGKRGDEGAPTAVAAGSIDPRIGINFPEQLNQRVCRKWLVRFLAGNQGAGSFSGILEGNEPSHLFLEFVANHDGATLLALGHGLGEVDFRFGLAGGIHHIANGEAGNFTSPQPSKQAELECHAIPVCMTILGDDGQNPLGLVLGKNLRLFHNQKPHIISLCEYFNSLWKAVQSNPTKKPSISAGYGDNLIE